MDLCKCGCGKEVTKEGNKYIRRHNRRGKTKENDESVRKMAEKKTGRTKENNDGCRQQAEKITGRTKENDKGRKKQAETRTGRTKETHEYIRRQAEKMSEYMKAGGSARMNSCIKNRSKPQTTIYENVRLLFPNFTVVIDYPFLNYSLDVAILEHKIAIEYDGWYFHEGPWGDPKKDIEKQKRCVKHDWKFVRYKGTRSKDIVPTSEQLKQDINKLIS